MIVINLHTILHAVPRIMTGEVRFWGNVGENGKDELVWELEN